MLIFQHKLSLVCFSVLNSQKFACIFSIGTDDDHRVILKSISDGVDCEHDYINATYIDVRSLKIMYMVAAKSTR